MRENGEIRRIPLGLRSRRIDFGAGLKLPPRSLGRREHRLSDAGIGNIEVYVPISPSALAGLRRLGASVGSAPKGDSVFPEMAHPPARARTGCDGARENAGFRLGRGGRRQGRTVVARLRVPNGYTVTSDAAVAIARRLLASEVPAGFPTPARLMGSDFVTRLPGATQMTLE